MSRFLLFAGLVAFVPTRGAFAESLEQRFPQRFHRMAQLPSGLTHYEDRGESARPVVVLVHGVSGPMAVWDRNVSTLEASGYRVVRFDLFGRGFSARLDSRRYTLPLYVTQLDELLNHLAIRQPVAVVGSSFGAVIASEFATRFPSRVRQVVLVGPAGFPLRVSPLARLGGLPIIGQRITNAYAKSTILGQNEKYFTDRKMPAELGSYFAAQIEVPGSVEAILATMRQAPVQTYAKGYAALAKTGIPVSAIWGVQDDTFPFSNHSTLHDAIPALRLHALDRAAHLPQYERADATNELLLKILATPTAIFPSALESGFSAEVIAPGIHFTDAFFARFPTTRRELELAPGVVKAYSFPTHYADVTSAVALFPADYRAAERLLPAGLKPVRTGNGRAIVVFSSYRYAQVRGMKPYSEVAVSVLVVPERNHFSRLLPLVTPKRSAMGAYVISMPVTSRENRERGHAFWGLPKEVRGIDLRQVGGDQVTTVADESGSAYLRFRVPVQGKPTTGDQAVLLYSSLGGKLVVSQSVAHGTVFSQSSPRAMVGLGGGGAPSLEILGNGPLAKFLTNLGLSPRPLRTQFGRDLKSTFSLPRL